MTSSHRPLATTIARLAALSLLAACGQGATSEERASDSLASTASAPRAPVGSPVLTPDGIVHATYPGYGPPVYRGGPVLNGEIYLVPVFYGTAWQPKYQSTILSFLGSMSRTSYWQVAESYSDSQGHHPGAVSVFSPVYQTDYAFGRQLSQTNILQIAQKVSINQPGQFIIEVFTADDVGISTPWPAGSGTFCTDYGGWHAQSGAFFWENGNFVHTPLTAEYALIGSPQYCNDHPELAPKTTVDAGPGPHAWNGSPNGSVIDEAINGAFHEAAEAATDPDTYSGYNPEIGDICAWEPGPLTTRKLGRIILWEYDLGAGAPYASTQVGYASNSGPDYLIQTLWDTKQNGCAYGPASDDCETPAAACGTAKCGLVPNGCGGHLSCGLCSELAACVNGQCVFHLP